MVLSKYLIACAMLIGLALCGPLTAEAQRPCVGGMCRHGLPYHQCLAVGCAPKRDSYGYYPTSWRRWPNELAAATPTPAAEAGPTPDESQPSTTEQDSGPRLQPEQPRIAPEEGTLIPSESETEPTAPEAAPSLPAEEEMLPFQDAPPQPPSDTSNEPQLPGLPSTDMPLVPDEEPAIPSNPLDDAPPTMPDDNPFLDDPIQPESTTPSPTSMDDASDPAPSAHTLSQSPRAWRSPTGKQPPIMLSPQPIAASPVPEKQPVAESLVSAYVIEQPPASQPLRELPPTPADNRTEPDVGPELLPPPSIEPAATSADRVLPDEAPARRNPLRMVRAEADHEAVVPVASWSAAEPASLVRSVNSRRNPLRDN